MLDKLKSYLPRHQALAEKLADPDIVGKRDKYMAVSKEFAEVSEFVNLYHGLKKAMDDLNGARELCDAEEDSEMIAMAEAEIERLEQRIREMEAQADELLNPPDPFDGKNVILEIRAGTGGEEAGLFAADLFRMYSRYAERRNWRFEILNQSLSDLDGFKEVIVMISGIKVYGILKYESGVHRVQRVPETEASGRIHTSAVTVAVLPEADEVEVDIDPGDLRIDVFRSSGPGGQSVNTTDSAVRVTHLPSGLVVSCQDEKSQHKNKAKALKILQSRLLDMRRREQEEKIALERRQLVSTGDRSAKIRTYNFPQSRISDHRINLTTHRLHQILEGDLDELLVPLHDHYRLVALEQTTRSQS
ncbi:peptide chain release factor 1 [bacterium]|nr:peptide chain release factor 1 [candidate division CSSED10-310 bacterium]